MTDFAPPFDTLVFDAATRALVRLAARIAAGTELEVRNGFDETTAAGVPARWVEEALLQSYLFAGFPRTLNAAREWRRAQEHRTAEVQEQGREGSRESVPDGPIPDVRVAGEATCARVYGRFYEKLRHNIAALHPELDAWMIDEGYGKVLSRPGLDLARRELCVVAACVASGQDRQVHSHLHGARNVGAPASAIVAALQALDGVVAEEHRQRAILLWARVQGK